MSAELRDRPAGRTDERPAMPGRTGEPPGMAGRTCEPPAMAGRTCEPPAMAGCTGEPPATAGRTGARPATVVIRRGTRADAAAAANLYVCARRAAAPLIPPSVHDGADLARWMAEHVLGVCELWLAAAAEAPDAEVETGAGALLGLMVLSGDWLDQLYVAPEMTGRGIGSRLVEVAKRECPSGLRLWTFVSNRGAQRFYARHGFTEVRRTDGAANEERAPDILFAWTPLDHGGREHRRR